MRRICDGDAKHLVANFTKSRFKCQLDRRLRGSEFSLEDPPTGTSISISISIRSCLRARRSCEGVWERCFLSLVRRMESCPAPPRLLFGSYGVFVVSCKPSRGFIDFRPHYWADGWCEFAYPPGVLRSPTLNLSQDGFWSVITRDFIADGWFRVNPPGVLKRLL